jgi:cytochrome c oxidase subunit 2
MKKPAGRFGLALLVVPVVLGGCLPTPATAQGRAIADLWTVFLVPAVVVAALVWGLATVAILRFRRRADDATLPPQTEGHTGLELLWTSLPVVTVLILFGFTMVTLGRIEARAPDAVAVTVTAFRWQWRIEYPTAGITITGTPEQPAEMIVPVGRPIHVTLVASDIAHAFYVPAFLFKRDAIPGRTTSFDLTVEEAGTYRGQCAEFCGVFHDQMLFSVRAVPPDEFERWLAATARAGESRP